jgi:hypothetical protein
MTIKRYISNKDNTVTNAFDSSLSTRGTGSNMGASDILEVFSIYGQAETSSLEKSRAIVQFPIDQISSDRSSKLLPASGSVEFFLKMCNAEHPFTTPKNFTLSVSPLLQTWDEGDGLDMETYKDVDASNWIFCDSTTEWFMTGGTEPVETLMNSTTIPAKVDQTFTDGLEDLKINITPYVEEWLKDYSSNSVSAQASITIGGVPTLDRSIKIHSTDGDFRTFIISTSSATQDKVVYIERVVNLGTMINNITQAINNTSLFSAQAADGDPTTINITQTLPGFFGNTKMESTLDGVSSITNFTNGSGINNRGILVKLSGSFENGSLQRSYYTKKFFANGSEFFFKRPNIEARWDKSILDDRIKIFKSSSLAPKDDNLNNIYFYNKVRGFLKDIPTSHDAVVVQFYTSSTGGTPESLVSAPGTTIGGVVHGNATFVTASAVPGYSGVYKATFCYNGSKTDLVDIWGTSKDGVATTISTGSGFTVFNDGFDVSYESSDMLFNITNLKSSYGKNDNVTFQVYTRNAKINPTIYTSATQAAQVTNVKESYYKIKRVVDNYVVVPYSTGSSLTYSKLSYGLSGSYFDFNMSNLEPNYLYEISFLRKNENDYIEQKEKFKFRVNP